PDAPKEVGLELAQIVDDGLFLRGEPGHVVSSANNHAVMLAVEQEGQPPAPMLMDGHCHGALRILCGVLPCEVVHLATGLLAAPFVVGQVDPEPIQRWAVRHWRPPFGAVASWCGSSAPPLPVWVGHRRAAVGIAPGAQPARRTGSVL